VSLEVSPLLAHDAIVLSQLPQICIGAAQAQLLHQDTWHAGRPPAIEAAIFAGVPVNVTLLFSREHYIAAAEAYLRVTTPPTCGVAAAVGIPVTR